MPNNCPQKRTFFPQDTENSTFFCSRRKKTGRLLKSIRVYYERTPSRSGEAIDGPHRQARRTPGLKCRGGSGLLIQGRRSTGPEGQGDCKYPGPSRTGIRKLEERILFPPAGGNQRGRPKGGPQLASARENMPRRMTESSTGLLVEDEPMAADHLESEDDQPDREEELMQDDRTDPTGWAEPEVAPPSIIF